MNFRMILAAASAAAAVLGAAPANAVLTFTNNPLYLIGGKANVLITLDNSNSMDENAAGAAVGSDAATSKSEIARGVIRQLTDLYVGRVNMGLMAYRLNTPLAGYLHNSPYDVSYDGGDAYYDPAWTGERAGGKKSARVANVSSAGNYVHFNVNLPFYDIGNQGNAFCYSSTANANPSASYPKGFNNGENPIAGPWDAYRCFRTKTGTSNTMPAWGNTSQEAAQGYGSFIGQYVFSPTDSDFAQGILDFGKQMTWQYVSRAWYVNSSPGRGFLHVPLAELTSTQASAIKSRLACNVPGAGAPCSSAGIQNAGLTPIEGTLLTAKDYFGGSWNNGTEGYVSSCYPLPVSCGKNFVVLLTDGLPSNDRNGVIVSNPSTGIAAAAAAAAQLKAAGIETYVIGFALPYGTDPNSLNAVAVAGGTATAYSASDTTSLQAAFKAIFDDIFKKTSAFASISQNSNAINAGSRIFQGRFDSTDWSGELQALRPLPDGTRTLIWSTNETGRIKPADERKVFSRSGGSGIAFKLLNTLSTAPEKDMLRLPACSSTLTGDACGQARINWLRGDQSLEAGAGGPFRRRTKPLGDIISSGPNYVADSNTVFVGANDGMLHAFDATTGNEHFAYLPGAVVANVGKLTDPNYAHQYYVDGDIAISSKAVVSNKNILVGALGRGGRSLFALDVSNPATFDQSKVLWEYTDADLGLVLGKPLIAKLNNGRPAVIVGNGYNSDNERAVLIVIDLETGALIKKIDTLAGSSSASNGMASPRGWDINGNGTVDWVFAGDRQGNLWKFDLRASSTASWASALNTGTTPLPLFVAQDAAGNRQPITGGIGLGVNPRAGDPNLGKLYVFFGTGQYMLSGDPADKSVQSWYGIIDGSTAVGARATNLKQRTILAEGTVSGTSVRAFSQYLAGDMAGKRGWYLDWMPVSGTAAGERIVGDSKYVGFALVSTSIIPSTDVCQPGGAGYVNAIDPFTGASLDSPYFDISGDGNFTDADALTLPDGRKVAAGSFDPGYNLPSDGIIVGNQITVSNTKEGQLVSKGVKTKTTGRLAWREIVRP